MTSFTAAAQRQIAHGRNDIGTLTWEQVDDVLGWAGDVDGVLRARLMISQIASDATDKLATCCADAILATDRPEDLVKEVVSLVPVCRASMAVISQVLRTICPNHALAAYDLREARPFALYDAIDDGDVIRVSLSRGERAVPIEARGLLLGAESPMDQVARFHVVRIDEDSSCLKVLDDAEWLERARVACPPMIVIA